MRGPNGYNRTEQPDLDRCFFRTITSLHVKRLTSPGFGPISADDRARHSSSKYTLKEIPHLCFHATKISIVPGTCVLCMMESCEWRSKD